MGKWKGWCSKGAGVVTDWVMEWLIRNLWELVFCKLSFMLVKFWKDK